MKKERTKTTNYIIRINGDFHKAFVKLREARDYIRSMKRHHFNPDDAMVVDLIKQCVIDTVMNRYKTEPVKVLMVDDLGAM